MKKINTGLMILSGLALVGLTGCTTGTCEDNPVVENVPAPAADTAAAEEQGDANDKSSL